MFLNFNDRYEHILKFIIVILNNHIHNMHILKDENICKYMSFSLQNLVEYWFFFQTNGGLNGDLLIYYVFSAFAYYDHNT
jgi:hypothetical protein